MLRNEYTFGSDPELFIFNSKTKKVISAIDKIPGYKDDPYTEGLPEGFGLQTDNILAEFNIPPVNNVDDFISFYYRKKEEKNNVNAEIKNNKKYFICIIYGFY